MKRLAILGSTGSIGRNVLEVVRQFPERFQVVGLAAGRNAALLAQQIQEFRPLLASVQDETVAGELRRLLEGVNSCRVVTGIAGAKEVVAATGPDLVIAAMVGAVGLEPTLAAIQQGHAVALANKETLVVAGALVMAAARQQQVPILPIDSEHSAISRRRHGGVRSMTSP